MDRDLDKEKIIEKMRSLRDKRDLEILNQDLEEVNLDSDYQKELPENKVLNIKYLGKIEINNEPKDIYLVLEQKQKDDGNKIEIERYCTEDGEILGGNNNSDQFNFITPNEKYKDVEGLVESLQSLDKQGILDLNEIEQERLEQVAKELGITVEEIKKISEIDSEKTVEDNEKENLEKDKNPDKEKKTLSKKQVESISTKQEIKTEQKVTDKDTMASLLNVQGKGYRKIAIVYSDKFKEAGNTTKFSFVGIKQDGSAEKIDTIEQAYGTNPTKNVHSVNRDGSKIEEEKVNSIFKIKGKTETQIAVDIGNMGTIEPSLVRTPAQDNEEAISIPIETSNIRPTTRETRELMNRNRNTRVKEEIKKIKAHEELGCEDFSIKDIDDNPNNNTHEHQEFSEEYLDKCASKILESETIANTYNRSDVKAYIKAYVKRYLETGNETIDTEDLINNVLEEMEQEAEKEHPLHQNTDRD